MFKNYLNVTYKEKDLPKSLGARWDNAAKKWYVPEGYDLSLFSRWLSSTNIESLTTSNSTIVSKNEDLNTLAIGISLSQFLQRVSQAVSNAVPAEEWIKVEVNEYRAPSKNSQFHYFDLVEVNSSHQILCKAKALISKTLFSSIDAKFLAMTGGSLKAGIKILILAKGRFHIQHGFSLIIEDIDPRYTLGDMAANLVRVREQLKQEGIYDKNKRIISPKDFTQIAVISPDVAAGLGDFKKDADLLQLHHLCNFKYYAAQFQGQMACQSIKECLKEVIKDHKNLSFDAIIIIRGGGSAIDLAWLDDYSLAKMICECPLAVFTGIGHERDNTILDEVANRRFDTPSKVINHLFNLISNNAQKADEDFKLIKSIFSKKLVEFEKKVGGAFVTCLHQFERHMCFFDNNVDKKYINILNEIKIIIKEEEKILLVLHKDIINNISYRLEKICIAINNFYSKICDASFYVANNQLNVILEQRDAIFLFVLSKINETQKSLRRTMDLVALDVRHACYYYAQNINSLMRSSIQCVENGALVSEKNVKDLMFSIVSLGPDRTLKRGFAIVRDYRSETVTTFVKASKQNVLQIQFYDGQLNTKVIEGDINGK